MTSTCLEVSVTLDPHSRHESDLPVRTNNLSQMTCTGGKDSTPMVLATDCINSTSCRNFMQRLSSWVQKVTLVLCICENWQGGIEEFYLSFVRVIIFKTVNRTFAWDMDCGLQLKINGSISADNVIYWPLSCSEPPTVGLSYMYQTVIYSLLPDTEDTPASHSPDRHGHWYSGSRQRMGSSCHSPGRKIIRGGLKVVLLTPGFSKDFWCHDRHLTLFTLTKSHAKLMDSQSGDCRLPFWS